MSQPVLQLIQIVSKISNASKPWKKDIYDTLNDPRFFQSPSTVVREGWLPVLGQLSNADKGLLTELSSRLTTPAAAGLMFGVGASAARLDADKKTQLNLRRLAIVVLAAEETPSVLNLSSAFPPTTCNREWLLQFFESWRLPELVFSLSAQSNRLRNYR